MAQHVKNKLNMFETSLYKKRRGQLKTLIEKGIGFFPGNEESPMNYPSNTYHYRQDSTFLYFFGLSQPGLAGIIDFHSGEEYLFGNDVGIDDIIWMGDQPSMEEKAARAGIRNVFPMEKLEEFLGRIISEGREVHYLPPYRGETIIKLHQLLGKSLDAVTKDSSRELIRKVIMLRSIKDEQEIKEIEKIIDVTYDMHTTAMKMAHPGVYEREIAGVIEGIALSNGGPAAFPVILSINGQILHNHYHGNILEKGRLMVVDAGAESPMGYAGDITRTSPVGGKFSEKQKEIYEIVLNTNLESISMIKPGILFKDIHNNASMVIAKGLKDLGLMKGDIEEAVNAGAHALFFPHGLGHMLGLDVHDMEGLGENYVGYNDNIQRSEQFGTAYLRLAKNLKPGFVLTIEPGIYFIPALIDLWKKEKKFSGFINYDKVEDYRDFGGIRIEDDVLVTETGHKVLGKPIPKTVEEVEEIMSE
jgi:Xaa-Pro aminopeptidase